MAIPLHNFWEKHHGSYQASALHIYIGFYKAGALPDYLIVNATASVSTMTLILDKLSVIRVNGMEGILRL